MTKSSKEAVKLLETAGFNAVRQTGSHLILRNAAGITVSVPMGRKDMKIGTLKSIERTTGVKLT